MSQAIRYNDTQAYEYITCFSTYGVFTKKQIEYTSLPIGFHTYYITEREEGIVSKILPAPQAKDNIKISGTFICKESMSGDVGRLGCSIDWKIDVIVHTDHEFHFEEYFGVPPSLDCQIENAYQRQEMLIRAKKKKRKRLNQKQIQLFRGR